MWSHYASHHRGIAIQFSFKDKLQNALFPLSKVKYRNHRPVVDEFSKSDPNLHLSDALAIKANFWKYEREWRALKPDKSGSTIKFESKVITGIVFGVNCTVVDEHEIRNLAQNHSLAIYRMRPDLTTFDLSMIPLD